MSWTLSFAEEFPLNRWLTSLVVAGRSDLALEFAEKGDDESERVRNRLFVALAEVRLGRTADSERTLSATIERAGRLGTEEARQSALALAAAVGGDVDRALESANLISDRTFRDLTVEETCAILVSRLAFDAALQVARSTDAFWRPQLLMRVTDGLLDDGQADLARATAREALASASPNLFQVFGDLNDEVLTFARAGLAEDILAAMRTLPQAGLGYEDALEEAAVAHTRRGDIQGGLGLAHEPKPWESHERAKILARLAGVLRQEGNVDAASSALNDAIAEASVFGPDDGSATYALGFLADALLGAGRDAEAIALARRIGSMESLARLAGALARAGKWTDARREARFAFRTSRQFGDDIGSSGALLRLVRGGLEGGHPDFAQEFVELARTRVALDPDGRRNQAYPGIAESFALLGRWSDATAFADRCESPVEKLLAYSAIVDAWTAIGEAAAR